MVNMALGGTGHTHTQTRFSNFGPKCDAFKAEIDEILEIKAFECMEDVQKGQKFGECRSCPPNPRHHHHHHSAPLLPYSAPVACTPQLAYQSATNFTPHMSHGLQAGTGSRSVP